MLFPSAMEEVVVSMPAHFKRQIFVKLDDPKLVERLMAVEGQTRDRFYETPFRPKKITDIFLFLFVCKYVCITN
jgi:hypothetical protein